MTDTPEISKNTTDIDRSNGSIDIVFLSDTGYTITETPNKPLLDNTMVPIYYDKTENAWKVCDLSDTETWYNYEIQTGTTEEGGTSRWANVMLTDDMVVEKDGTTYSTEDIKTKILSNELNTLVGAKVTTEGSMLVWIPRYAYKITYTKDGKTVGYSDSRGIVTIDGKTPKSYNTPTTSINVTGTIENTKYEYYRPHPAFETDLKQGGWSNKITGIWVGKFDATGTTSEITTKSSTIVIRNKTIGTLWNSIKDNFKAKTSESHMIKNSEWGALVYLAESKYGRNKSTITQNTDSNYYTGGGTSNAYITNKTQSTTGNVYGVYDTVGGICEYTASYIPNSQRTSGGCGFANIDNSETLPNNKTESTKYATTYNYDNEEDSQQNNYNLNLNKIFGDATTETSINGTGVNSWYSQTGRFPNSDYPFFSRGGGNNYISNYTIPGLFYFDNLHGGSATGLGTRVVCIVQ